MPNPPLDIEDIYAGLSDSTKKKPTAAAPAPTGGAVDIDDLYGAPAAKPPIVQGLPPTGAAPATPKPRRTIGDRLHDAARAIPGVLRGASIVGNNPTLGAVADVADLYASPEEHRLLPQIDRRTDTDKRRDDKAEGRRLIAGAAATDNTTAPSVGVNRKGEVVDRNDLEDRRSLGGRAFAPNKLADKVKATEESNFSPEHWREVAVKGMELANTLHAQGKHDEAEDVLRKAYNAQLVAENSKTADTFGAIALSNLLGIVKDPYAGQRRNLAEAAQPGTMFSPKEQQEMGTTGASPVRGSDMSKDLVAPLVGQLPVIVAGGLAGRAAAGIAGAGAERLGFTKLGQGLARLAAPAEEAAVAAGPGIPSTRTGALLRARIEEEATTLRANLPQMLKRGATEGQVVGAIQSYRMARQQGATPEQALAAVVESLPLQAGIGMGAEVGLGALGKALGLGYDMAGRATGSLTDAARDRFFGGDAKTGIEMPVDRRAAVSDRYASSAPLGPETPPIEPKRAELGDVLDHFASDRRAAREAELTDAFRDYEEPMSAEDQARMESLERIANGLNVQRSLREEAHTQIEALREKYQRPTGETPPHEQIVEPADAAQTKFYGGGQPDTPLRTAADVALQPHEEANAFVRMQRAQQAAESYHAQVEAEANDPNLRLEQAAQQRPGEVQGPKPLAETLEQAGHLAEQGEPLAADYHEAINTYVDAAAAVRDAGPGAVNTRQQVALARARKALNDARTKYGKQLGASAVLALAANDEDLTDDEKKLVGLGGLAILSTEHVGGMAEDHPVIQRVPFYSRVRKAIEALPKAWDAPRVAVDWVGKLGNTSTFTKEEFNLLKPHLQAAVRDKVKLSRADVLKLADDFLPQLETKRLTEKFKEDAEFRGDSAIHDMDDVLHGEHARDVGYVEQQAENRENRAQEIRNTVRRVREDRQSDVTAYEAEEGRTIERAWRIATDAQLTADTIDPAIEVLRQHIEGDQVPYRAVERAMDAIDDDLLTPDKTMDDAFAETGWTVEQEPPPAKKKVRVKWTDANGVENERIHPFNEYFGEQEHRERIREQYGPEAKAEFFTEEPPPQDEWEYVVRDRNGINQARDYSEAAAKDIALTRAGLYPDRANLRNDLRTLLDELAGDIARTNGARDRLESLDGEEWYTDHEAQINHFEDQAGRLRGVAEEIRNAPPVEPDAPVAPNPDEVAINTAVHGQTKYANYQRLPNGRDYREVIVRWKNPPIKGGNDIPGAAYGEHNYWRDRASNATGHFRADVYDLHDTPGVTPFEVTDLPGDSETVRELKQQIRNNRELRAPHMAEYNEFAKAYDAIPAHQRKYGEESFEAGDLRGKMARILNDDLYSARNEELLMRRIRTDMANGGPEPKPLKTLAVLESQVSLSQAQAALDKEGIAERPALEQQVRALRDEQYNLDRDWRNGYNDAREGTPEEQAADNEIVDYYERNDKKNQRAAQWAERPENRAMKQRIEALGEQASAIDHRLFQIPSPEAVADVAPFDEIGFAQGANMGAILQEAVAGDFDQITISDDHNRIRNAMSTIPKAARQWYGKIIPSAMERQLGFLGFKVKLDKTTINGEGVWRLKLTPEMKAAIKKMGTAVGAFVAMTAVPQEDAEAQDGTKRGKLSPFATGVGGALAGAALVAIAGSRSLRRLLSENKELHAALMRDDLSGLANQKAFLRAKDGVDHDPRWKWVTFDGDRFKTMNDTHGHAEGDRAIQHFGKTVMDVAEEMGIPMRGFRNGGDELSFAAPASEAAEFMRRVEERSHYTKGDVSTGLTGGMGESFEIADAMQRARKAEKKALDPSLAREGDGIPTPPAARTLPPATDGSAGDSPVHGATAYANPIGPAMRQLARYPKAATLAAVGALVADQSDNPDLVATGKAVVALAALSAIGSARIWKGKDNLAGMLVKQLAKSEEGLRGVRFFNPDALLHPDVLTAIKTLEADKNRAAARAAEFAGKSKALGPQGDRLVSDIGENEQWEDTNVMDPKDVQAAVTVAAALDLEYQKSAAELLASGARTPEQLIPGYFGKRVYAVHEAEAAQAEKFNDGSGGGKPRISNTQHRTLDDPIRAAEATLAEAQKSGNAQAIRDAQDAVDAAKVEQLSKRTELGEIRESSYRASISIERAYSDAATARFFNTVKNIPGVLHPEWQAAVTDLKTAQHLFATATTQADRDAARALINDAKVRVHDIVQKFSRSEGEYVALPDSRGLGEMRGAVVQRDVANSINGFDRSKNTYAKLLRAWKEMKTVFNPGTHQGNVLSNITFSHMEGLHLWEQPAYLKRAKADLTAYGPATRALTEAGILDVNAVQADLEGVAPRDVRRTEGLESLLGTSRPETVDRLREHGITEERRDARVRKATVKGALGGAALGAMNFYNEDDPGDAVLGAVAGGLAGGAFARGGAKKIRTLYANEDNLFRAAIWLKKVKGGMTPAEATAEVREALGNFRSRSPALQMARSSVAPFILYPAKVLPRFAKQVIDHPWRYMALIALWGGLNEYSKQKVGEVPTQDIPIGQRRRFGYALPGFTQLPFKNERGERANIDIARFTPLSALTTAAPPGSVPASFDERIPDIFRAGGPAVDLAARFGANVDAFSGKPAYGRDLPLRENLGHMANDVAGTMLPTAVDVHVPRMLQDIRNRNFDKLSTDATALAGARPRYTVPGANTRSAMYTLESSLRDMKQQFRNELLANHNPARGPVLTHRYLKRVQQALDNFRSRMGLEPDARIVRDALEPK